MAVYPCARGGHRYAGAQQSIYLTRMNGAGVATYKMRLCPKHMAACEEQVFARLVPVDEQMQSSLICEECDQPKQETIFARVFRAHDEEGQFVRDLCAKHAAWAWDALGGGDGEPMGGR